MHEVIELVSKGRTGTYFLFLATLMLNTSFRNDNLCLQLLSFKYNRLINGPIGILRFHQAEIIVACDGV